MKTHPIRRCEGWLLGFEITSAWVTFRPLYRILRSVEGVTDIKRHYFREDRISFSYRGESCVVHEPWGDSSRYWVGPRQASRLDITPVLQAFQRYQGTVARVWSRLTGVFSVG